MPFDLAKTAARLRVCHGDPLGFRHALLDLLFAAGCGVSEQAVALEHGDALCIRAAGPNAPSLENELLVVAVDLEPPHLAGVAASFGEPSRWPKALASLGGPTVALSWVAALRALVHSGTKRPWRALYLRGPALGLGAYVRGVLSEVSPRTEMVQVVPSIPTSVEGDSAPCDLVRLDLVRSRNVWRFPACDLSYAIRGNARWESGLSDLRATINSLGSDAAWTLHDVHLYHAQEASLAAVLRTSSPLSQVPDGISATEVDAGQRLMFPVNDALAALGPLSERLNSAWGDALQRPVHMHVLPDGLRIYAVTPVAAKAPTLPAKAGNLSASWQIEPLAVPPSLAVLPLSVSELERLGPVPPGAAASGAVVWQFPVLADDSELAGVSRALASILS